MTRYAARNQATLTTENYLLRTCTSNEINQLNYLITGSYLRERNRTEGLVLFNVHFCVNLGLALLFSLHKILLALLNCALSVSKQKVFVMTVQTMVHTFNVRALNYMRKLKQEADKIVIRD
jgi:hypothetical protein